MALLLAVLSLTGVTVVDPYADLGIVLFSALKKVGVSDAAAVDEMVVRWPRSGVVQKFQNVAANRIVQVTEGSDALVEKRYVHK